MELTSFQELIFSVLSLVTTSVISLIGYYIKSKIDISKYGFDNDRFERIIDNGVKFSENKANEYFKQLSKKMDSNIKLETAKGYINDYISKEDIKKYKLNIERMIERKIQHKHGISIKI